MLNNADSPYIRGLGFLYLRFRFHIFTILYNYKLQSIIIVIICEHFGFGYNKIDLSLPPEYLLAYFEDYLEDEYEIDPKAGGGDPMTVGQMVNIQAVSKSVDCISRQHFFSVC